ncbi:TetR/AcrR family transcriptional regulator [Haloglycomyces albus]|uniref:TetR/AcrR family transcriptional regulator n=1 Tax=Haloglycomyces albus TaxID=526067 RepID=UPI0004B79F11|nr:TetR/AcrR family transcriptional regulator [Haloglycomyces albus]
MTRTAIARADATGLDSLTMRRLATDLGVATSTVYRYFGNRDELLANMVELALSDIAPRRLPTGTVRERMSAEAWREWQLYQRHPWILPVLARVHPPLSPALLDMVERYAVAISDRSESGEHSVVNAHRIPGRSPFMVVFLAISGLAQGLAMVPMSGSISDSEKAADRKALGEWLESGDFPYLKECVLAESWDEITDFDDVFEQALGIMLDGLEYRRRQEE